MEENNEILPSKRNEFNLYQYSNIDLVSYIKEESAKNNNKAYPQTKKKNSFLEEIADFIGKQLNYNISLHQQGFKVYKQKLLADKTFIQNSLNKELRNLKINQLIEKLTNLKNNSSTHKPNKYFNIGQNFEHFDIKIDKCENSNQDLNKILFYSKVYNNNVNNNPFLINNFFGLNNNQDNKNENKINNGNEKNNKNNKNIVFI